MSSFHVFLPKIVFVTLLLSCSPLVAQDGDDEEVIVISELSRAEVEEQLEAVEDDLFRQFNAYNTGQGNEILNIECRRETPTGTHFPVRVCEPVFLSRARQENNRKFAADLETRFTQQQLESVVADQTAAMNAAYAQLIEEDAIFAEVVGILAALRARLAELQ